MSRFTFTNDNDFDNTHVDYSFDAESIHDVFDHMKYFLRACGYEAAGDIGLFPDVTGEYDESEYQNGRYDESEYQKDYTFDNIPNNSWPFGETKPASAPTISEHEKGWYEWVREEAQAKGFPAFTSADLAQIKPLDLSSLTVTDLSTMTTHAYNDWTGINKYPTMAPLTTEQITSWKMDAPGTVRYTHNGVNVPFDKNAN